MTSMASNERVRSAFERTGHDRIPVKHEGTPEINRMLILKERIQIRGTT